MRAQRRRTWKTPLAATALAVLLWGGGQARRYFTVDRPPLRLGPGMLRAWSPFLRLDRLRGVVASTGAPRHHHSR